MKLIIETLTGSPIELKIPSSSTVLNIKERIEKRHGIPVSQQSLLWRSAELTNESYVKDHNIGNGATLKLVLGMRGGPVNMRRVPVVDEPSVSEMAEYFLDAHRERSAGSGEEEGRGVGEAPTHRGPVTVILYSNGDKLNFYRLVDRDALSSLSLSLSSDYEHEEDSHTEKERDEEIYRTKNKMKQLREHMEHVSIVKERKNSMKHSIIRSHRAPSSGFCPGSRSQVRRLKPSSTPTKLPHTADHTVQSKQNDHTQHSLNPNTIIPPINSIALTPSVNAIPVIARPTQSTAAVLPHGQHVTRDKLSRPESLGARLKARDAQEVTEVQEETNGPYSRITPLQNTSCTEMNLDERLNKSRRSEASIPKIKPSDAMITEGKCIEAMLPNAKPCEAVITETGVLGAKPSETKSFEIRHHEAPSEGTPNDNALPHTTADESTQIDTPTQSRKSTHSFAVPHPPLVSVSSARELIARDVTNNSAPVRSLVSHQPTTLSMSESLGAGGGRGVSGGLGGLTLQSLNHREARAMSGMLNRIVCSANRSRSGYLLNPSAAVVHRGGVSAGEGRQGGKESGRGHIRGVGSGKRSLHGSLELSGSGIDQTAVLRMLSATRHSSRPLSRTQKKKADILEVKNSDVKRCAVCRKKTKLTTGFLCRCGIHFCILHRYAEAHSCTFDYKTDGRKLLEQSNPVVTAPKLPKL